MDHDDVTKFLANSENYLNCKACPFSGGGEVPVKFNRLPCLNDRCFVSYPQYSADITLKVHGNVKYWANDKKDFQDYIKDIIKDFLLVREDLTIEATVSNVTKTRGSM